MRVPLLILTCFSCAVCFGLPISFEQRDPDRFLARFTNEAAEIRPDRINIGGVTLRFMNADAKARMEGLGEAAPSTYFRTGISRTFAQYRKLAIRGLYPWIDAVFHGNGNRLEYDFNIAAGASTDSVRIRVEGSRGIRIDATGNLIIENSSGVLKQIVPTVFQGRGQLAAHYVLLTRDEVGIWVGKYDRRLPLTIDPVLRSTKYFGGSGSSSAVAIATDSQGNLYLTGQSNSIDFPTTTNGFQPKISPPLLALSNGAQTMTRLQVATEDEILAIGGTSDGKILYAQGFNGMYLSVNSGATWRAITSLPTPPRPGSPTSPANSISVDAISPSSLLVATSTGLYFSSDAGGSWFLHNTGLPVSANGYVSISQVFINPNNHLIAYAVTNSQYYLYPYQLFKSVDSGNTWTPLNPSYPGEAVPPSPPLSNVVAALAPNGNDLYVVNASGTLVKSVDVGATWQQLASQLIQTTALVIDPSNPANIYVLDAAGVQKSSDGGATFSTVFPSPAPGTTTGIQAKAIALDSSGALYVSAPSQEQILVSADGGATLKPLPEPLSVQTLTAVGGTVFAGLTTPSVPFVVKLDPSGSQILYSTFLGGTFVDGVNAIAVDTQGNAVITGYTFSPDFPVTVPPSSPPSPGKNDAFISKLSSDGTHLVFSLLLGASKAVSSVAVAVDSPGAVYITGLTSGSDFPTTAGVVQASLPMATCPRMQSNFFVVSDTGVYGFVTKISADGTAVIYSTFLTGSCGSAGGTIAVDATGEAVVAGYTTSPDFPVSANAYQSKFPGQSNQPTPPNPFDSGFVTKLSAAADKVIASTFLGGGYSTSASSVTLDSAGNAYLTGFTQGITPGATPGAFRSKVIDNCTPTVGIGPSPPYTGTGDAFALKLDPAFSTSQVLTYLGGSCNDSGSKIAVDATGNIWVAGTTQSPDFPLLSPFEAGGGNLGSLPGFVSELSADGSRLLFSSLTDGPAIALSPTGAVYVAGQNGRLASVAKIDPSTNPKVIIDSIAPVIGFPPSTVQPFPALIAPGQYIQISGSKLGPASKLNAQLDATGRLPFILGGTAVYFGEIPAPLISVQATSIVCFVPFEASQPSQVTVSANGQISNAVQIGVTASAPQILSIANQDGSANSASNPAKAGTVITLYVSGLGQTNPPGADGLTNSAPLPVPEATVSVFLPGGPIPIQFAGAAPGQIAGITQINAQLPPTLNFSNPVGIGVNSANATLYATQ